MYERKCANAGCENTGNPLLSNCCSIDCELMADFQIELQECKSEISEKNKVIESLLSKNIELSDKIIFKNKLLTFFCSIAFIFLLILISISLST